ncbi:transposase, MuDR, MULE transposase domain protein [Tanacetum coccineum]|uniref:Transposase, MuDR, MULE transposase domain protein n=1 Tax=Tanacetum coccineum TaxID=301880 RepID=A0ABQ5CGF6_9ASTR
MSDNIPFDIQMDIMNRLPVKSLLQFRTVSKQWKFSINNFEFIRKYGVRERNSCYFNLSYKHENAGFMYSVDENLAFRHMDSNLNIFSLTPVSLSEGVWCFAFGKNSMLLLWNPSIKKSVGISVPNYTFQPDSPKMIFGFGIRPVTLEPTLLKINYPLYSDGPWYKETNLVAVGMDGNNQIVPIAFGICKGETSPCWSWWMSVLKECIGDSPNLLFISDRHAAIALAVHNEFPLAFHVVCCHHLMMNLSLKSKKTKGLLWKICKAYTPEEFSTEMSNLQAIQPYAYHKLIQVGPQRWSRAHCPLVRYNYMTSNSVESVNACIVLYRKLSVLKLAETYREMVQEWYFKR